MPWLLSCVLWIAATTAAPAATDRLAEIRARGTLICGIWPHVPGFAMERGGRYTGFEVDVCRAVAAAIIGDADKVGFVPLASIAQFASRPDIDLAIRRLTWTLGREAASGTNFGPVVFYDGQGFLVPKDGGIHDIAQLAGERVCVIDQERHPETLDRYFRDNGRGVQLVPVASDSAAEQALRSHRCRAYSADLSWLAAARAGFPSGLARFDLLPGLISKEPLAPLLRAEDAGLLRLVRWTIYTLIEAEELGISSRNVGVAGSRLPDARARAIIAAVGNYGEVYDRNLGVGSPIRLDRGLNRLWNQGGLMYAPPLDR